MSDRDDSDEPVRGESNIPQFWHVSWPVPQTDSAGQTLYMFQQSIARDEQDARPQAQSWSRQRGHATVTNRAGLVATYVNGEEWRSPR